MRFELKERVGVQPAELATTLADPDFYATWTDLTHLGVPEVLDASKLDGLVKISVQHRYRGHVSSKVAAVVDPSTITWTETSEHDLAANTATLAMVPDHHPDRLTAGGTSTASAIEGEDHVCRWTVKGSVKVSVPFFGRQVEKAVIGGLRHTINQQIPLIEAWVRNH